MFEVGFLELALLGVIALLVVGPSRLPGLVRTVGVWVGRAQRLVAQVRTDIEREVRADELRKAATEYSPTGVISDVRKEMEDFASDVSKPLDLDAGKPGSAKPEPAKPGSAKPGSDESGSEESAGSDGAPPAAAAETESRTESEPPGTVAGVAPEAETGEPDSAEPCAPGGPDSRSATAAPRTAAGTANGAEAPADGPPAAEPAGPGEAAPAAPAMTESAEAPPAGQDERTAAA